jgi:molecular chaperone GrpE (heat shock protein)
MMGREPDKTWLWKLNRNVNNSTRNGTMNEERIAELEKENDRLRRTIKKLRAEIESYRRQAGRSYKQQQDYLPYDEDDRR